MSYPTRSLTVQARRSDGYLLKASGVNYAGCQSATPGVYGRSVGHSASDVMARVGQRYYETHQTINWRMARGFFSFDTGILNLAEEIIDAATLYLAAKADNSDTDFNVLCYTQGATPWGPGLSSGDWTKCATEEGSLATSGIGALDTYCGLTLAAGSINTSGRTDVRLHSSREGTDPKLNGAEPYYEDVDFWGAWGTYPPKIVLGLRVPEREAIILDIVSALQGIDGTGDYNLDFSGQTTQQVWRSFRSWDQLPALPALCIVEGDCGYEAISASPLGYTAGSFTGIDGWPIDIIGTFQVDLDQQSSGDMEQEAQKLESDVKIAILADPLRGNSDFVRDTYHVATVGPVSLGGGKGAIRLTFAVKYDFDPIPS